MHLRDVIVDEAELLLQHRAPPLGLADLARLAVRLLLDELQRDLGSRRRIARQVDVGHSASAEAPNQTVGAEVAVEHSIRLKAQGSRLTAENSELKTHGHRTGGRGEGGGVAGGGPTMLSRATSARRSGGRPAI